MSRQQTPQIRGGLCLAIVAAACQSGLSAMGQVTDETRIPLYSPYVGVATEYDLPIDNRPTIVVIVDAARTLLPMELIRGLRLVERLDDRVRLVMVFVGERAAKPDIVESALEQRSLLEMGLKSPPQFLALTDRTGDWYASVGAPAAPHAFLMSETGATIGREILIGPFAEEVSRIERALDPTAPTGSTAEAADQSAIADAVQSVSLLPAPADGAHLTKHERTTCRLDVKAIVEKLYAMNSGAGRDAVLGYCDSALNFTLGRRFALAAMERFDAAQSEPAKRLVDSGAEGWLAASHYQLDASLSVENASNNLRMSIQWNSTLKSRWDGAKFADSHLGVLLGPGSDVFVTNDKFQSLNAGWGDYLIHNRIVLTMSEGDYPDSRDLPTLTREWDEFASFFPRNEYAEEDDSINTSQAAPVIALRSALNQALRAARSDDAPALNQDPAAVVENAVSSVKQAFSALTQRRTGPAALTGKPFAGMKIQSWVQGQKSVGMNGPGRLTAPKGRVMLVDFMFVECPPCRAALPELTKLHEKHRERGLVVVSAVASWGAKGIYGLVERKNLRHPVAVLSAGEEGAFSVTAYPTYVLIDRKGMIRWAGVGGEPDKTMIEELLVEKP